MIETLFHRIKETEHFDDNDDDDDYDDDNINNNYNNNYYYYKLQTHLNI